MSYFTRVDATRFFATAHVGGAWNPADQHIAPALGLLVHLVERDRDERRDDRLAIARLSYDILGTVPIDVVDVAIRVLRPGRSIDLVEARLVHADRAAIVLRAWLMQPVDTAHLATTALARIPPPDEMRPWDPTSVWAGGFIESVEVRRAQVHPGRAAYWVRTPVPLIEGEDVSALARLAGLFDIANGITVAVSPKEVAFPNLDLTAHLFRQPSGEWLGFDTAVSLGATGVGLTHSVVHDGEGPFGTVAQCLTLRPGQGTR